MKRLWTCVKPEFVENHNQKKLWALMKREFWEHHNLFVRVPGALGVLICVISLCSMIYVMLHSQVIPEHDSVYQFISKRSVEVVPALYAIASPFVLILWLVVFNYSLSCFFDERKDRSILFWQSLPINQTLTVMSKVLTALILSAICSWVCIIATELFLMVVYSILFALYTPIMWWYMWNPILLCKTWIMILLDMIKQGLWLFPIVAWCMLCSVQSSKAPFIRAILVPIVLIVVEVFFDGLNVVSQFIADHFSAAALSWAQSVGHVTAIVNPDWNIYEKQSAYVTAAGLDTFLVGLAVGVVFLLIAGWCRRTNAPENISLSR